MSARERQGQERGQEERREQRTCRMQGTLGSEQRQKQSCEARRAQEALSLARRWLTMRSTAPSLRLARAGEKSGQGLRLTQFGPLWCSTERLWWKNKQTQCQSERGRISSAGLESKNRRGTYHRSQCRPGQTGERGKQDNTDSLRARMRFQGPMTVAISRVRPP